MQMDFFYWLVIGPLLQLLPDLIDRVICYTNKAVNTDNTNGYQQTGDKTFKCHNKGNEVIINAI